MDQLYNCSTEDSKQVDYNNLIEDKCLIADNNNLKNYTLKYKINEQIHCKELPIILLKTNNINESIKLFITDLKLVVADNETDIQLNDSKYCPLINNNNNLTEDQSMFASSTRIWMGITFAIVGALIIFGFILFYEKVIRKKFMYSSVRRQESVI